jgi:hypothetical protein
MFKLPGATYPMEPFIPMELRELTEASVTASFRILAMPKSPTRALMS